MKSKQTLPFDRAAVSDAWARFIHLAFFLMIFFPVLGNFASKSPSRDPALLMTRFLRGAEASNFLHPFCGGAEFQLGGELYHVSEIRFPGAVISDNTRRPLKNRLSGKTSLGPRPCMDQ